MDRTEAQKVSDSYMSDLVADRVDLALDKMEPQFLQAANGDMRKLGFSSAQTDAEHRCADFTTLAELLSIQKVFASSLLRWCQARVE